MSGRQQKPTRWLYVLAVMFPVLACMGTVLLAYQNVPELPGALEMSGTENLTQVLVPGSAEIYFPKAGAYAVYYEYQSIFDGVKYAGVKSPPDLHCQLSSKATGEYVPLASEYIEGNVYNTENQERAGVLIKSTRIDQPGVYRFACQYTEGATAPEIVLAVGPNLVWEFFNLAAKPLAALLCGAVVFSVALGVSILIIVFTAYTRHRSSQSS